MKTSENLYGRFHYSYCYFKRSKQCSGNRKSQVCQGEFPLFLHPLHAGIPRGSDLIADRVIAILELVEEDGVQLLWIDFALLVQHRFIGFDVHDFANDSIDVVGVQEFEQFAFHHQRELLDDWGVHLVARDGMISGPLEFVVHPIARSDAEEIGDVDMGFVRQSDREGFAGLDVQPGLLSFPDEEDDLSSSQICPQAAFITLTFLFSS